MARRMAFSISSIRCGLSAPPSGVGLSRSRRSVVSGSHVALGTTTKGDVTRVESAVDAPARVAVTMQYDGFGNVTHTW
jgi:hypothetical protein